MPPCAETVASGYMRYLRAFDVRMGVEPLRLDYFGRAPAWRGEAQRISSSAKPIRAAYPFSSLHPQAVIGARLSTTDHHQPVVQTSFLLVGTRSMRQCLGATEHCTVCLARQLYPATEHRCPHTADSWEHVSYWNG
jgi:hypothetical protein